MRHRNACDTPLSVSAYLFSPLAIYFQIPVRYLNLLVFGVFLFGAVFVYVVMGIIREALSFLELIK